MYFRLNPECYFVMGSGHGAIFDLMDNKIYALSREETEIAAASEGDHPVSGEEIFLRELKKLLLGNFYTNKVYIHKMGIFNPSIDEVISHQPNLRRAFLEINNSCERNCWFCGSNGIKRSLGCMGCNKWNEDGQSLKTNRWKALVEELRDLDCEDVFITGGDLTLAWDKTMEILDYAKGMFSNIYTIIHQESLSESHLNDLKGKAQPIVQIENLSNAYLMESSYSLLIATPEHWKDAVDIAKKNKNTMLDFVIRDGHLPRDLPIMSQEKIVMPGMVQFLQNMRYHPCIRSTLAVSHTGNVLPCPMMRRHRLGNIRDRELYTLFEKGGSDKINSLWKLNLDKIDKCSGCEFRYSCGDCRALEESLTGRLKGKAACSYNPEEGTWA
jgi:radical SAM protein with 4Fe4S-binding SPASM domain